jgi:hypothetical protein
MTDVGFGIVPGIQRVTGWGHNGDVSQAAPEDVWEGGGLYPWLTVPTSLEVVSTSANDVSSSTGANFVRIVGLDSTYKQIELTVSMNGTTPAALPTQLIRINQITVLTAGTAESNVGTINVRDVSGGTVRGVVMAMSGTSHHSMYTVPNGKSLQVIQMIASCTKFTGVDRTFTLALYVRGYGGAIFVPIELDINTQPYALTTIPGFTLPEKTDMWLRISATSSNNMNITAGWAGLLRTNYLV